MKITIAVLAVVTLAFSWLLIRSQTTVKGLRENVAGLQKQLDETNSQLQRAQTEIESVKRRMQAEVDQLQQSLAVVREEKSGLEEHWKSATTELADVRGELEKRQVNERTLSATTQKLQATLDAVSQELTETKQSFATLQEEHSTTIKHLTAIRDDYVKLNKEYADLVAKWNDLQSLQAQIAAVKRALHAEKVAQRDRDNRAGMALGNRGYFMKGGSWTKPQETGKFPLNEGIYRN